MRPQILAFVIFLIHCPLLLFAASEIQYSPDFVDPTTGITLAEIWKQATITNPEIQTANRKVLEAQALKKQAALFPNPELQVHAGTSSILGEPGDREPRSQWRSGMKCRKSWRTCRALLVHSLSRSNFE